MAIKFLVSCGGTGGHIFPGKALAKEIETLNENFKTVFGGRKVGMEKDILAEEEYRGIDAYPLKRGSIVQNLFLPFKLLSSYFQAKAVVKREAPKFLLTTGGYVTLPFLFAARSLNVPVYIQEQNEYAGVANKIGGRWAKAVFPPSDQCKKYFPSSECFALGNPVREIHPESLALPEEYKGYKNVILVVGGSQGAKGVNQKVSDWVKAGHLDEDTLLFWQTGKWEYDALNSEFGQLSNVITTVFINDIYAYIKNSSFVISRAGASTIAELTVLGKAALFIPFPYAAENHQEANARELEKSNAALVELESENEFAQKIEKLKNKELRESMQKASLALGKPNATKDIARKILKLEGF